MLAVCKLINYFGKTVIDLSLILTAFSLQSRQLGLRSCKRGLQKQCMRRCYTHSHAQLLSWFVLSDRTGCAHPLHSCTIILYCPSLTTSCQLCAAAEWISRWPAPHQTDPHPEGPSNLQKRNPKQFLTFRVCDAILSHSCHDAPMCLSASISGILSCISYKSAAAVFIAGDVTCLALQIKLCHHCGPCGCMSA